MNLLTIVSILSIVIVLGFLLFIFFDVRNLIKKKDYTEMEDVKMNTCPDFFELDDEKKDVYCKNTFNLGSGQDFYGSNKIYKDFSKKEEAKCDWARLHNVSWDGIDRLC